MAVTRQEKVDYNEVIQLYEIYHDIIPGSAEKLVT